LDTAAKNNNQVICYAVPGAMVRDTVVEPAPGTAAMAPTFTPGSPTFSAIFQEIIVNTGCNGGSSCHASLAGGNLVMQTKDASYAALVNMKAMGSSMGTGTPNCADSQTTRVMPGMPEASLLVSKVTDAMPKCGSRMPPGGMLKPEQIKQITDWVTAGAKND
jgi:hypothetical protein